MPLFNKEEEEILHDALHKALTIITKELMKMTGEEGTPSGGIILPFSVPCFAQTFNLISSLMSPQDGSHCAVMFFLGAEMGAAMPDLSKRLVAGPGSQQQSNTEWEQFMRHILEDKAQ